MNDFYKQIINLLHKRDSACKFTQAIINAMADFLNIIDEKVSKIYLNFFFSSLTIEGVEYFEKLLKISPTETQSIDDRKSTIQAKWLSNHHNSIVLIQRVCNAWKRGEVEADFKDGKIRITFINNYGIPDDLDTLLISVGEVKPAHIGFEIIYKFLLIEDIHEALTIEDMENLTLDKFTEE